MYLLTLESEAVKEENSFILPINRAVVCDQNKDQKHHHFKNANGKLNNDKSTVYKGIDFSFSIFDNCYFRNARFEDCVFVGCKFYDSNFKGCEFISCRFDYSLFENTIIPSKELIVNLPKEHNVRAELLQNLRSNAVSQCEYKDEKLFILHEIEATKCHYKAAATKEDSYYKEKYPTFWDGAKFNIKRLLLWFDGITWGHGEKPQNAVFFLLFSLSIISAIISTKSNSLNFVIFFEHLYYSILILLDIDQIKLNEINFPMWAVLIIAILRYLSLGLLISMIYRKISHR